MHITTYINTASEYHKMKWRVYDNNIPLIHYTYIYYLRLQDYTHDAPQSSCILIAHSHTFCIHV